MWHAILIEEMKGVKWEKERMREGWAGCTDRKTRDTSIFHNCCILCLTVLCSFKPLNSFPVAFYSPNGQICNVKIRPIIINLLLLWWRKGIILGLSTYKDNKTK